MNPTRHYYHYLWTTAFYFCKTPCILLYVLNWPKMLLSQHFSYVIKMYRDKIQSSKKSWISSNLVFLKVRTLFFNEEEIKGQRLPPEDKILQLSWNQIWDDVLWQKIRIFCIAQVYNLFIISYFSTHLVWTYFYFFFLQGRLQLTYCQSVGSWSTKSMVSKHFEYI